MLLHEVLDQARNRDSGHPAVIDASNGGTLTYAELNDLADGFCEALCAAGVAKGDRVGLLLGKSADAVASIFGILKAGAAYVPADSTAPISRCAFIHNDCGVRAVVVERRFYDDYSKALAELGSTPHIFCLDGIGGGVYLRKMLDEENKRNGQGFIGNPVAEPDDLAYILYTSGSTGTPKGVMLSHRNAMSFINWCVATFDVRSSDVFSSHAPFHFDLSVFDIYVSMIKGGTLVIISETAGKRPEMMADSIARYGISVWYSAPSTLTLLANFASLEDYDLSTLKVVLFAGEVMPVNHLRTLKQRLPAPAFYNLYGPTETNVCTYHPIPEVVPDDRVSPYPIGKTCANLESCIVDDDEALLSLDKSGELCIAGGNVMLGYWGRPEQSTASFLKSMHQGKRWYKTGDVVSINRDGDFEYLGRKDRMVKKRGNRVELGEIEACLYRHEDVREAAVVAVQNDQGELMIKAHISTLSGNRISQIRIKTFCSGILPLYMIPDVFEYHAALPKTSTGKLDLQKLQQMS